MGCGPLWILEQAVEEIDVEQCLLERIMMAEAEPPGIGRGKY